MPRYFTKAARTRSFWVEDETYSEPANTGLPTVCDHEATFTGLLDEHGGEIWRGPNPIGFRFDEQDIGG